MYLKKTYRCGEYMQVIKTFDTRSAPRRERTGKGSTEAMTRWNERQRAKHVQRIILANFAHGVHVTLSYRLNERPESMEAAKKEVKAFIRKMRRECDRCGRSFKWICVTERGKKGACHHHLIMDDMPELPRAVAKNWKHGHTDISVMYEDGAFWKLAEYILKKETKEENEGCTYSRSRNLIVPAAKVEPKDADGWRKEPKPPRGWEIVPDTLVETVSPVTGLPYQEYILKRKEVKDAKKDDRNRRKKKDGRRMARGA